MATTIVTKYGSDAPATTDIVRGELAVDTENGRLYTENSSAAVVELGSNPSGNITFGDNGKAIFGAGSDLQIYHDPSAGSIIQEAGAGSLFVRASTNIQLEGVNGENMAIFNENGSVQLYHDNAEKLATTATGIDISGSATAASFETDAGGTFTTASGNDLNIVYPDGRSLFFKEAGTTTLTLDNVQGATFAGAVTVSNTDNSTLKLESTDTSLSENQVVGQIGFYANDASTNATGNKAWIKAYSETSFGNKIGLDLATSDNSSATGVPRLNIAANGDISFYEDTGTTAKLFWDASAESLGIGTSSPASGLELEGTGNATNITLDNTTASTGRSYSIRSGNTGNLDFYDNDATNARMVIDSSGGLLVGTTTSGIAGGTAQGINLLGQYGAIEASRSGNASLYLNRYTSDGKIAEFRKDGTSVGSIGVGGGDVLTIGQGSTYIQFHNSLNSFYASDGSSGRDNAIDIGAPLVRFKDLYLSNNINTSGNSFTATTSGYFFGGAGSYANGIYGVGVNNVAINANGSERMRIDSSGNVGIGESNPTEKLSLGKGISYNADSALFTTIGVNDGAVNNNAVYRWRTGITGNATGHSLTFSTLGRTESSYTERMRIDSSGNLLVGTTSFANPANGFTVAAGGETKIQINHASGTGSGVAYATFRYNLSAVGSITQHGTSATLYNTTSDERLKENIVDADDAGSKVDSIKVRQYDWKADGSHQDYGMIAQELIEVAPEAVSAPEDPEEMMGVDYSKLVPMLVKEIQQLRQRVAQLEE